jgi:hypothetical protein
MGAHASIVSAHPIRSSILSQRSLPAYFSPGSFFTTHFCRISANDNSPPLSRRPIFSFRTCRSNQSPTAHTVASLGPPFHDCTQHVEKQRTPNMRLGEAKRPCQSVSGLHFSDMPTSRPTGSPPASDYSHECSNARRQLRSDVACSSTAATRDIRIRRT